MDIKGHMAFFCSILTCADATLSVLWLLTSLKTALEKRKCFLIHDCFQVAAE